MVHVLMRAGEASRMRGGGGGELVAESRKSVSVRVGRKRVGEVQQQGLEFNEFPNSSGGAHECMGGGGVVRLLVGVVW